jgi:hypothetical protein
MDMKDVYFDCARIYPNWDETREDVKEMFVFFEKITNIAYTDGVRDGVRATLNLKKRHKYVIYGTFERHRNSSKIKIFE